MEETMLSLIIWAYVFATIGILTGLYAFKNKQWKPGAWIICISLLIFAGGNIRIDQFSPSVSNSFNFTEQIDGIKSDLAKVKLNITQAIDLKQEVSQTVNVITKVEKEIANIKETIQQIYNQTTRELFLEKDLDSTVKVFDQNGKKRIVYFQLNNIPIHNSVEITHQNGAFSPATFSIFHNIVALRTLKKLDRIFKNDIDFYYIKYYRDHLSEESLLTLKDMVYQGTDANPNKANFSNLVESSSEKKTIIPNN